jgi:putative glutamine amidotransferase
MSRTGTQPIIGVSCGTLFESHGPTSPPGVFLRHNYIQALVRAGSAPLIIPPMDESALRVIYEQIDGVLLSGGEDIHPRHYHQPVHETVTRIDEERDEAELCLTRWALEDSKPLLGICRGIQMLNVACGGTLHQDVGSFTGTTLNHRESEKWDDWTYLAHELELEPDSLLARLLDATSVPTNSIHHQGVAELAPGLRAVGRAPDGLIEAVEGTGPGFVLAVQSHPEALQAAAVPRWQGLFAGFVAAVCAAHPLR